MFEWNYVFLCDPVLNQECKKAGCQRECKFTTEKKYSADGKYYRYNEFYYGYEEETDPVNLVNDTEKMKDE